MKTIFTSKGQPIYVDDEDYDWLNQWRWCLDAYGYAVRKAKSIRGQKITILRMHRALMGLTSTGLYVDHRNGVRHDNQRVNLRLATNAENGRNRPAQKNNKSGYKGVSRNVKAGKWRAQIKCNGVKIYLGLFDSAEAAHAAYCAKARELHGEFANTGIKND